MSQQENARRVNRRGPSGRASNNATAMMRAIERANEEEPVYEEMQLWGPQETIPYSEKILFNMSAPISPNLSASFSIRSVIKSTGKKERQHCISLNRKYVKDGEEKQFSIKMSDEEVEHAIQALQVLYDDYILENNAKTCSSSADNK